MISHMIHLLHKNNVFKKPTGILFTYVVCLLRKRLLVTLVVSDLVFCLTTHIMLASNSV